jgi:type IV pilus assembly protein PilA
MMKEMIAKRMALKGKDQKGFTLVEVIVVLVILAILMAIAVPALTGYIDKARNSGIQASTATAHTALQAAATDAYSTGYAGTNFTYSDYKKTTGSAATSWADVVQDLTGSAPAGTNITPTYSGSSLTALEITYDNKKVTWTPANGYVVTTITP